MPCLSNLPTSRVQTTHLLVGECALHIFVSLSLVKGLVQSHLILAGMIFSVAAPSMAVLFDKRSNRAANKGLVSATLLKNGVPTVTPQIAHINLSTALIIPGEHGTNWRHAMEKPLLWRVWITNKVVPTRVCRFSDLQFTHQCMFIKSCASTHGTWKQAVAQGRTQPERLSV